MKFPLCLSCCFLVILSVNAQNKQPYWKAGAAAEIPVGLLGETHLPGVMLGIDYAKIPFGKTDSLHQKQKTGLLLSAALHYYPGKQVTVSNAAFRYKAYSVMDLYAGLAWNSGKNLQLALTGGPSLSYYRNHIRFNLGARAAAGYFFHTHWGMSTAFSILKENGADPFFTLSLGGVYRF